MAVSNGDSSMTLKNSDSPPIASVITSVALVRVSSNVSKNAIPKSSLADFMILNLDSRVSSICVAIRFPVPVAFSNCVERFATSSAPSIKTLKAETAL